ncbi:SusC/RagA family TonB-linked outer membrane protein [Rhodohalobacter sulfatireducens]|uniref:TonB-dependent receptor n=1 Tax=Rhodohalobacter sulfatireducens TaxID=2911366 RepID=A0ABS9KC74_9BACT|nr:TonB-dependent receptor [Rhodohalobacter sulfatireducens]MCG2588441.1 TonB-dependent receptor [Rhodohalobacter sulfatireducens]
MKIKVDNSFLEMPLRFLTKVGLSMYLVLFLCSVVNAQDIQTVHEVSGTVTDASDGETLLGVNIMVVGTTTGTTTDMEGNYTLSVPSTDSQLRFSYIGYQPVVVNVEGRSTIDVEMEISAILGEDIVVTGYSAQRRIDLTGSISVADVPQMQKIAESSVSRQLQGQVSGVTVSQSGQPGDEPSVRIRGIGNFGNVSPLYVVDGVPTSTIGDLNPRDVESLQVLKDASAASIYGARASNGVIIITTKQGRPGLRVSFDSYVGYETPKHHGNAFNIASPMEMAELEWLAYNNSGLTPSSSLYGDGTTPQLPDYIAPAGAMEGEVNHDDYYVNPYYTNTGDLGNFYRITRANKQGTNWFQEIFKPAYTVNSNLAISGGTDDASYMLSLNYINQEGTLLRTYNERYTLRVNTQFNLKENIRIGQNASIAVWENPQSGSLDEGTATGMVYRQQPIIPVYDIAGNFAGNFGAPLGNASNPVAQRERTRNNTGENNRIFGNVFAEIDFLESVTFRSNFGGSYATSNWSWFQFPEYENAENAVVNLYGDGAWNGTNWTWTNTVTYTDLLAEVHNINIVLGTEANEDTGRERGGTRTDYFSFNPNYVNLSNGAGDPTNYSWQYENALFSVFGRAEYNYDNRYLLNATVRRDGSSRFLDNRYGLFPSGSIGWRISEEAFMRDVNWLTNLQLRAGYGVMGNQLNVASDNAYSLFGGNQLSTFYPITGGPTIFQGFAQTRIGNPAARWEESHTMNIGVNTMLFDGALEIDMDFYKNDVRDLLFNPELPGQAGLASQPYVNVGNVENKGLDMSITGRRDISQDFNINATVNFTTYSNEVVKIAEGVDNFDGTSRRFGSGNPIVRNQVGWPISTFFGYKIEGFWNEQSEIDQANASAGGVYQEEAALGRFRYADVNGDGRITADDRTRLGDPHPDFTYGLDLTVNYKSFDVSAFFYGSEGNDIWNQVKWWTDFYPSFQGAKSKTALYNSWTPDNHDAKAPIQENAGSTATNLVPNSYYVEDGSYLRLRTIQVGYSFTPDMLSYVGLNRLRVYVQAQNLFTITNYSGPDPEVGNTQSANASTTSFGVDEGAYPTSRQFLFGFNLGF